MKITSVNFLRLSLLMPYIFAAILYGLSLITDPTMTPGADLSGTQIAFGFISVVVYLTSLVYLMGALYWLIPYTILVLILWIWSKKKTKTEIYRAFIRSPFLLAIFIFAFSVIVSSLNWLPNFFPLEMNICSFPLSLIFGYGFIGLTAWVYGFLKRRNIIVDEETIIPTELN